MSTPTHMVEMDRPYGKGIKMQSIYGGLDAAITFCRSKMAFSESIPLEHKTIFRIREHGAHSGEFVWTAAG